MWVFGYGSLMWDSWETKFNGQRYDRALLRNHQRDFNKASTSRWGTRSCPCPTLGLRRRKGSQCVGTAFYFEKAQRKAVLGYLSNREGVGLKLRKAALPDGRAVMAYTVINIQTGRSFIGHLPIENREQMVLKAKGTCGECYKYLNGIVDKLQELKIEDSSVTSFIKAVEIAKKAKKA